MSGKWGTCDWNIDDDGVLTISGGVGGSTEFIDSTDYSPYSTAPWYQYKNKIKKINIEGNITFTEPTKLAGLFYDCTDLSEINGLEKLDTTNVTSMKHMFDYCWKLTTLDLSNFNTSNVTDMSYMFYHCEGLTILDLSNFNTTNVTSMKQMFLMCEFE